MLPAAPPASGACKGVIEGRVVLPLLCSLGLSPRTAASRAPASSPRLAAALPPTTVAPVAPLPPALLLMVMLVVLPPAVTNAPAATRPSGHSVLLHMAVMVLIVLTPCPSLLRLSPTPATAHLHPPAGILPLAPWLPVAVVSLLPPVFIQAPSHDLQLPLQLRQRPCHRPPLASCR